MRPHSLTASSHGVPQWYAPTLLTSRTCNVLESDAHTRTHAHAHSVKIEWVCCSSKPTAHNVPSRIQQGMTFQQHTLCQAACSKECPAARTPLCQAAGTRNAFPSNAHRSTVPRQHHFFVFVFPLLSNQHHTTLHPRLALMTGGCHPHVNALSTAAHASRCSRQRPAKLIPLRTRPCRKDM